MARETNKSRRQAQAQSAREKAAAARVAQQRADQRRRAVVIISSVVALALIGVIIAVAAVNSKNSKTPERKTTASPALVNQITSVPSATLASVGKGGALGHLRPVSDTPLTVNGKPGVLYIGGEFCPFCAGERWALIQALSRFGSFSGLQQIRSSEDNFPTFDFVNSTYTSKYLSFTPREIEDENHNRLQTMTSEQQSLFAKYSGGGNFPFVYIGGKYYFYGADLDVTVLNGLTWQQVASDLKDPSSKVAQAIDGEANYLTAALCTVTGNKPAAACTSTITGLQSQLPT